MVKAGSAFATLGALLISGAAYAAPESLSKVDTANGEILLEVQASGMAMVKIAKVSTYCDVSATAPTKAEAEKALADIQKNMRKSFNKAELASAVLDFSSPTWTGNSYDFPVAIAAEYPMAPANAAEAVDEVITEPVKDRAKPGITLQKRIGVSVGSTAELQKARVEFAVNNCVEDYSRISRPIIDLGDPLVAQSQAKSNAIIAAKKQAEDYAAALGMRVVRIIRVSEAGAIKEFLGPASDYIMQEMTRDRNRQQPVGDDVPVTASISVDFALGPK